ncbi:AbaSI family restriction endonuclease [Vibrio aestuarianus]|uniref:AbaSI family restriction endonuclease n=1 Tax=Vibrio aestuarianus TaxID=28171 RepID=UPI00237D1C11|nr:hypothetical protein [Vibrio aestuarianus]MDE1335563.1 hypothetical protein [Vibrio aestuarianus]
MAVNKTEYVLKSISKIKNKKWEFYIITRIIHALPDDVEFITQQLVRLPDGHRALTDLYFPQFDIHLEIDEPHHENQKVEDLKRERDIIKRTEHSVVRIKIANDKGKVERSLEDIKSDTDNLIQMLFSLREDQMSQDSFVPWDFEHRYSSIPVINAGRVAIEDNVMFQKQIEALRCFGFRGNGYQRGAWQIPDGSKDWVWFPRLYEHGIWENKLTEDGTRIIEKARLNEDGSYDGEALKSIKKQKENQISGGNRKSIVFARAKDSLGFNLYRYVGTFLMNLEESTDKEIIFDRVSKEEKVRFKPNCCPICNASNPYSSRYPVYVCERCSVNPVDESGAALSFTNEGISGGFIAKYSGTNEIRNSHVCYIKNIKCWADEAHMGGIIIQPFATALTNRMGDS